MKSVIVLIALAGPAYAEERRPITLPEALAAAKRAPRTAPLGFEIAAAEASADAAAAWPDPSLRVATARLTSRVAAGASVPLPIFGTVAATHERAQAEATAVRAAADVDLRVLQHDIARAWIELARADLAVTAAAINAQHAAELELIARGRKDAGTGADVDITIAQAAKARAELEGATAEHTMDAASAELAGLLGWNPALPLRADGSLALGEVTSLDAIRTRLLVHPEHVLAEDRAAVAAMSVRETEKARWPLLAVEAEVLYDDRSMVEGNTRWARTDATIGVSLQIPIFAHIGDRVRAARAEESALRARIAATDAELGATLFAAYRRWQAASERVQTIATTVLPAQERAAALSSQAFREGARDLAFALQAQRDLATVRAELDGARADAAAAYVDLQLAAGVEVGSAK